MMIKQNVIPFIDTQMQKQSFKSIDIQLHQI